MLKERGSVEKIAADLWQSLNSLIQVAFLSKSSLKRRSHRLKLQLYTLDLLVILLDLRYAKGDSHRLWTDHKVGFSWLSRCLRDPDAMLRCQAASVLIQICRPCSTEALSELLKVPPCVRIS